MPNRNYIRGRNFEYRCIHYFRECGYYCIRSYGSKGIFDFIGIAPAKSLMPSPVMVQCKCTQNPGYLKPEERENLKKAKELYAGRVLHCYNEKGKIRIEEF